VGLPGETIESFSRGFDAVAELNSDEIQVGILKRLKGTPIIRHDQDWEMVYQEHPPFQILSTKTMNFIQLQEMNRFSQFWDLYANSGNFKGALELIKQVSKQRDYPSLFTEFFKFSKFLAQRHPQGNGIALIHLVESAWIYLSQNLNLDFEVVRRTLVQDYTGTVKRDIPHFLRGNASAAASQQAAKSNDPVPLAQATPKRQVRHLSISQQ
jgi:hypothetical protein